MESTTQAGDAELVSKTLQIEHKLFYLDLKENPRGRYLKISEKTAGSRSTIVVPLAGVVWFVDLFNYYANGDDNELSSKELQLDTKVFYFDVGENQRGRFLKVSEASVMRNRSTIIVPAGNSGEEGWAAFRNVLVEIHEASLSLPLSADASGQAIAPSSHLGTPGAFPISTVPTAGLQPGAATPATSTNGLAAAAPAAGAAEGAGGALGVTSKVVRAEQKKFYFDFGSNNRGSYLRISEVTGMDRAAIIVPASAFEQFHETFGQFAEYIKAQGGAGGVPAGGANVRTVAPLRRRTES